jgi:hypothetical protein
MTFIRIYYRFIHSCKREVREMDEPANMELLKEFGFKKPHLMEVGKDQLMAVNWPHPSLLPLFYSYE